MIIAGFELLDNERIDISTIKRDFVKVYHQQDAQLKDPDQKIEFIFGESNFYHQIGNAYLEFDITITSFAANPADRIFANGAEIRLVNKAFAFCFKEARLSTTGGLDLEHHKNVGQTSTIMRYLTSKDEDLS